MKHHIQLLMGMIGSGKSKYAHNAAKKGFIIINDDSLVEAVHGGEYTLYDKSCQPIYKALGISIFTHALAIGKSIVVDIGNRRRVIRERWTSLALMHDVPSYIIRFPVEEPEVHARRRYDSDHRGLSYEKWLSVAKRHNEEYESAHPSERIRDVIDVKWEQIKRGYVFDPEANK